MMKSFRGQTDKQHRFFRRLYVATLTAILGVGAVHAAPAPDAQPAPKAPTQAAQAAPGATQYQEECGSCHIAYPARFLPSASWQRTLQHLDDHFGENAELDAEVTQQILQYLTPMAADNRSDRSRARMEKQIKKLGHVPQRISELPWFVRQHDEIPRRMTLDNPKVGSFSRCDACHQDAAKGRFGERNLSIPGFGPWKD